MKRFVLAISILLSSCAIDYRTDYEKNNNIVLSEEVIEIRKAQSKLEKQLAQAKLRDIENRERIQQMINCAFQQSITSCH